MSDLIDRLNLTEQELAYLINKGKPALSSPPITAGNRLVVKGLRHEYSTMSPIDPKHRGIIIQYPNGFNGLHRLSDNKLDQMLPAFINHASEPRWMREDPDCLLFLYMNEVRKWNAGNGQMTTIRKFKDLPSLSSMGESDILPTMMALTGGTKIFVYDYTKDQVIFDFTPISSFNNFYLTPDGNVVVGYYNPGRHILHRKDGTSQLMATGLGHMDVGLDKAGNPIMVWCNSADDSGPNRNAYLSNCQNGVVLIDLYSGLQKCLTPIDWSFSMHISLPDVADSALVSLYNAKSTHVLTVGFDGNVKYTDTLHSPSTSYENQPHAAITPDGLQYAYNDGGDTWVGSL